MSSFRGEPRRHRSWEGLVDAIVEVTETGSTIRAHGLKIIHTLLETNTKLIANKKSMVDPWKRKKVNHIAMLLRGALNAENLVGIKMNVPKGNIDAVVKLIPSITAPTVAEHLQGRVAFGGVGHSAMERGAGAHPATYRGRGGR